MGSAFHLFCPRYSGILTSTAPFKAMGNLYASNQYLLKTSSMLKSVRKTKLFAKQRIDSRMSLFVFFLHEPVLPYVFSENSKAHRRRTLQTSSTELVIRGDHGQSPKKAAMAPVNRLHLNIYSRPSVADDSFTTTVSNSFLSPLEKIS